MIKKYVMLISAILVILMFTSTSSASFLSSKEKIYERLSENSLLKNILDRFSQVASDGKDSMSIDTDDDDGNDDDSEDGKEEDVLLPKIWNMVGEITPDGGNEPVDDLEETTTIDSDGEIGATQDDWTVEKGTTTVKLERFVKIVTELNGKLGTMLERVIERTVATDENGFFSGTNWIAGETVGTAENNKADVVVLTDGDQ